MSDEVPPIRIRAFVGRSFLEKDETVWYEIRRILESLRPIGLVFEDAKEAQLRPISEKVRHGIERNDFYIGILTQRLPIKETDLLSRILAVFRGPKISSQWTTSNWVVQESGFALGKGQKILLLIEQGVHFPVSDLDADTEWVPFDRTAISQCSTRLTSMIGNLISEKLPAVPATAQVAPSEDEVPPEEQHGQPPPGRHFSRVMALLNQQQFQQADEEFERFSTLSTDPWFRYFYLRLKSVRGHAESLQQLKTVVQSDPQNVDARMQLAQYYSYFKDYNQAVQILTDGVEAAPEEFKATVLRCAAEELAKDKQQERALKIIRDLIPRLTDPTELRSTFLSLANVAKSQSDRELESAALEHVLDLNPSDSDIRFRLAYLYSNMGKWGLSAYHYSLRLNQGQEVTALNNLGVTYGNLNLQGKEIEAFEEAGEDFLLAKANLSHAYADRGFLAEAERLATEVTRADCDETARNRATGALTRISKARSTEKETAEKIESDAKTQRIFRSAYAEAYVASAGIPVSGVFKTPHGNISFRQEGSRLLGEGKFEEPVFAGLFATLPGFPATPPTQVKVRSVKLEATIVGRSGRFKFKTDETEKGTLLTFPKFATVQGLLIIADDGESFEVLEEHEKQVKIYKARKIIQA